MTTARWTHPTHARRTAATWGVSLKACVALLVLAAFASAQSGDVIVLGNDVTVGGKETIFRFDRKLGLLTKTSMTGTGGFGLNTRMTMSGTDVRWIGFDSLGPKTLLRVDGSGGLLPSTTLGANPVSLGGYGDGRVYALTRLGLSASGPMYGVRPNGTVQWSNFAGPALFNVTYPRQVAATPAGALWIGDGTATTTYWARPLIAQIDPDTGAVTQTLELPAPGITDGTGDSYLIGLEAAPDGTLWCSVNGGGNYLIRSDGISVLEQFQIEGGWNGIVTMLHVDGAGRALVVDYFVPTTTPPTWGDILIRYDAARPDAPDATFNMGGPIDGFTLGPTGEEAFAVVSSVQNPFPRRLSRMNLRSGVRSTIPLDPDFYDCAIPYGDVTGFVYANSVNRDVDSDGDGASNGSETAAGSNPYDPLSRPHGPKVTIAFALSNNALILTYTDPDGLLDASGGLNLASLSVKLGPYGEVWNYLLPFLTFVQLSPDLTSATALFGALPLSADKKWAAEATVADKTGAVGWDWQVTPPGDL